MSVTLDVDDEPARGLSADGRPDPVYAADLGIVPAPAGRRSAAFLVDAAGLAVLAIPSVVGVLELGRLIVAAGGDTFAVDGSPAMTALILLLVGQGLTTAYGLVQLVLHGRAGRTIGKALFGIRSVQVTTFAAPGFWRIALRALVLWASQVVLPLIGPLVLVASGTWDPERRGRSWLDRIGRCYAIDVRAGLDPFDAKALRRARRALDAPTASSGPRLPSLATDRPIDEHTFIPASRSSSGVVSPSAGEAWTPPPLGTTRSATEPVAPPRSVAVAASARPERAAGPEPRGFVLVFDDGTRIAPAALGLLGRSPTPAPGEDVAQLVPLVDESMRISKTHAAFGVDTGGFWVLDRASRNGTVVATPDGSETRLVPGERSPVATGARVVLGGRSFTVTEAAEGEA